MMSMEISYKQYVDPEVEMLIQKLNPPRVCIDNKSCPESTLVKVDSANKHGILLEMVQVLTDLDLLISKSYVSSDGDWLMDVFHVTDQMGKKVTDENLMHYIVEKISANNRAAGEVERSMGRKLKPRHILMAEYAALEMTGTDRPGMMSEISAVLAELGCHITAAVAWTHKTRLACIIYVEDMPMGGPIIDPCRVAHVQAQVENVIEAHHFTGERRSVRLTVPTSSMTHTERRLHQLMTADKDYEGCCSCCEVDSDEDDIYGRIKYDGRQQHLKGCDGTHVRIDNCKQRGYYMVTVRSRDRPKLLFDTVCALTDMKYVVYHAAIRAKDSIGVQEYYVRHQDGCTLDTENDRRTFSQCLIAATERRISYGLRLDVSTENRVGLLSHITRVFRENGLSITRAELGTSGERAIGTFYVKDVSGQNVNVETLEMVRREIGATVLIVDKAFDSPSQPSSSYISSSSGSLERPWPSLGNLLWSQLERFSGNFLGQTNKFIK
ncbi:hypothetical protein LIER_30219 [Lithospermum erythrorhizon]|uniref:ACT domain-containing protein ACR n=1 Tax=Lithospermum erythrorhizon TaxID=34254 RepID=A0AAV3RLZ1_LITER